MTIFYSNSFSGKGVNFVFSFLFVWYNRLDQQEHPCCLYSHSKYLGILHLNFFFLFAQRSPTCLQHGAVTLLKYLLKCCLDPVTRIHMVYFQSPVGPGMFLQDFLSKKEENRQFFQSTHFTRNFPRYLLRLKLGIFNNVKFR